MQTSVIALLVMFIPKVRRTAHRNFYRVYPEWSDIKIMWMCFLYFRTYLDYFVEFAKFAYFSEAEVKKHCKFKNVEWLDNLAAKHQFVLCFCGHVSNFEMFTSLPLHLKLCGMCHLYLASPPNPGLDWLLKIRSKYGSVNIPSNSSLKHLLKLRDELNSGNSTYKGYVFGSLSDMDPKVEAKHSAPFLNHKLEVKIGAERIARRFHMGFCYAHFKRPKRGFYEVEFREMKPLTDPIDNPYAYTDEFVRQFDHNIREHPELWMQWGACRF